MQSKNSKRSFKSKSLRHIVGDVLEPLLEKYDIVTRNINLRWEEIVGKHLASLSNPSCVYFDNEQKIKGTLVIEISNPGFGLELQSYESIIISKINSYFGYEAIARIKLKVVRVNLNS